MKDVNERKQNRRSCQLSAVSPQQADSLKPEAYELGSHRLPSPVWRLTFTPSCLLLLLLFLLLSGCDTFQPLGDNDTAPFSMYGYLDASVDTQWVRVTPLRDRISQDTLKPEMTVTLEHMESGNTVVMRDSLIQYRQEFNVINVWTTMDIEPEQTYRVRAERPDGAASHVTITIPPDFPTPVLYTNENGASGDLHFTGVERVADVQTLWKEKRRRVPYRQYVREKPASDNSYIVGLLVGWDMRYFYGTPVPQFDPLKLEPRQVFVASGGPEWNEEIPSLNDIEYATSLEGVSNVKNGIGYVVGVLSKTIPFKGCFDDQREHIACPTEEPFF